MGSKWLTWLGVLVVTAGFGVGQAVSHGLLSEGVMALGGLLSAIGPALWGAKGAQS